MSTRAEIYFIDEGEKMPDVALYQWGDGGPSCVLRSLNYVKHILRKTRSERGASSVAANYIFFEKLLSLYFYGKPVVKAMAEGEFEDVIHALENLGKGEKYSSENTNTAFFSLYPHNADAWYVENPYKNTDSQFVYHVTIPMFDLMMQDYEEAPDWRVVVYDVDKKKKVYEGALEEAIALREKWVKSDEGKDFSEYLLEHSSN